MNRPPRPTPHPARLLLVLLLLCTAAAHPAQAARRHSSRSSGSSAGADGVDANFFYQNLLNEGTWYNTTEYGDVWRPAVADQQRDWRPYTDGYWADTEEGYAWVSNESFGWATYHYGRWTDNIKGIGWAWVPGYDWAPAWVAFRSSDPKLLGAVGIEDPAAAGAPPPGPAAAPGEELAARGTATSGPSSSRAGGPARRAAGEPFPPEPFIGWAPLPPEAVWGAEGFAPSVDADYDIAPEDYCFVPVRYFGAPRLRDVIVERGRNYDYVERSVNSTRIAYTRGGSGGRGRQSIRVEGPDPALVNRLSEHPVPRLSLQRETNPRLASAAIAGRRASQVEGNRLVVAAPRISAPTARTRLNRPPVPKVPVIARGERPTAAGVDAQTVQRVRARVADQARRAADPGSSSRERGQTRASQGRAEAAGFDSDRPSSSSSGSRESSSRGGRNHGGNAASEPTSRRHGRSHGDSGARVVRSSGGGGGGSRHSSGGRVRGGGGGGGRASRPPQFRQAPQRTFHAPPQQSYGGGGGGGGGGKKKKK